MGGEYNDLHQSENYKIQKGQLSMTKNDEKSNLTQDLFVRVGIDWDKAYAISDGGGTLDFEFEITPEDFIQFAELDLQGGDIRSLVNGLTNTKRAIDAQTDIVLKCLGIQADKVNKPKLAMINELGFVAPRIIKKIRDTRNLLEHEYKIPTTNQVEDAIDVATLYLAACSRTLYLFPDVVKIFNEDVERDTIHLFKSYVGVHANWHKAALEVHGVVNLESRTDAIVIKSNDFMYKHFVRLFAAVNTEKRVSEALKMIRDYLDSNTL